MPNLATTPSSPERMPSIPFSQRIDDMFYKLINEYPHAQVGLINMHDKIRLLSNPELTKDKPRTLKILRDIQSMIGLSLTRRTPYEVAIAHRTPVIDVYKKLALNLADLINQVNDDEIIWQPIRPIRVTFAQLFRGITSSELARPKSRSERAEMVSFANKVQWYFNDDRNQEVTNDQIDLEIDHLNVGSETKQQLKRLMSLVLPKVEVCKGGYLPEVDLGRKWVPKMISDFLERRREVVASVVESQPQAQNQLPSTQAEQAEEPGITAFQLPQDSITGEHDGIPSSQEQTYPGYTVGHGAGVNVISGTSTPNQPSAEPSVPIGTTGSNVASLPPQAPAQPNRVPGSHRPPLQGEVRPLPQSSHDPSLISDGSDTTNSGPHVIQISPGEVTDPGSAVGDISEVAQPPIADAEPASSEAVAESVSPPAPEPLGLMEKMTLSAKNLAAKTKGVESEKYLETAILNDDIRWVDLLTRSGYSLDFLPKDSSIYVQLAQNGSYAMLRYLADQHLVDVNAGKLAIGNLVYSPLAAAAEYGEGAVVRYLLEIGANVEGATDIPDPSYAQSPLVGAIHAKADSILHLLIEHGADVDRVADGCTPIEHAMVVKKPKMVLALAQAGAILQSHLFYKAVKLGDPDVLTDLMKRGLILDRSRGILTTAVCELNPGMVKKLLDLGFDPNTPDSAELYPLQYVIDSTQAGNTPVQVAELLLKAGADPNLFNTDSYSGLEIAHQAGNYEIIELMLEHGADINQVCSDGKPFREFVKYDGIVPEMVPIMQQYDVDPEVVSEQAKKVRREMEARCNRVAGEYGVPYIYFDHEIFNYNTPVPAEAVKFLKSALSQLKERGGIPAYLQEVPILISNRNELLVGDSPVMSIDWSSAIFHALLEGGQSYNALLQERRAAEAKRVREEQLRALKTNLNQLRDQLGFIEAHPMKSLISDKNLPGAATKIGRLNQTLKQAIAEDSRFASIYARIALRVSATGGCQITEIGNQSCKVNIDVSMMSGQIVKFLLEVGQQMPSDATLLAGKAGGGDLAGIDAAAAAGQDLNAATRVQSRAIGEAASNGEWGAVFRLIELGADANLASFNGKTPLIYAVEAQNYQVAVKLISAGAKPGLQDRFGETAITVAQQIEDPNLRIQMLRALMTEQELAAYQAQQDALSTRIPTGQLPPFEWQQEPTGQVNIEPLSVGSPTESGKIDPDPTGEWIAPPPTSNMRPGRRPGNTPVPISVQIDGGIPSLPENTTVTGVLSSLASQNDGTVFVHRPLSAEQAKTDEELINQNISMGDDAYREGDYDTAVSHWEIAVEHGCKELGLFLKLGMAHDQLNDVNRAFGYYAGALKIDRSYLDTYFKMAELYYKRGQNEKAIRAIENVFRVDPNHLQAKQVIAAISQQNR